MHGGPSLCFCGKFVRDAALNEELVEKHVGNPKGARILGGRCLSLCKESVCLHTHRKLNRSEQFLNLLGICVCAHTQNIESLSEQFLKMEAAGRKTEWDDMDAQSVCVAFSPPPPSPPLSLLCLPFAVSRTHLSRSMFTLSLLGSCYVSCDWSV